MALADTIAARITEVAQQVEGEAPAEGDVPIVEAAAESGVAPVETPAVDPTPEDPAIVAKRELIEAKLAEARSRRAIVDEAKRAKAEREAAAEDRKAAAEERAKYDSLKQGTFKQTLEALGRDPRQAFEEMTKEAIEANTPEAEMRRMRADFERQMGEQLEPLKRTIEELKAQRDSLATQTHQGQLHTAFQAEIVDPAYIGLRTEYDDADLIRYVKHFDSNPKEFYATAKQYGVRLTDPARGFTMGEILTVLKSAQDAHEQSRQQRAAKLAPPAAPSAKTPTVNGTAPRGGNAETTIGNDLAGERASPSRRLTRRERIEAEIARLEKR